MCVLFFAHRRHSRYPLVFAGNRDEGYDRPAAPAAWWTDAPHVLAGRDLEAGGTWLGVTTAGRWAVVTNVRDLTRLRDGARSRGDLVRGFLVGEETAEAFAQRTFDARDAYNPFNLIVGDADAVWYVSTHEDRPTELVPGLYGLSNSTLGVAWPKVERGLAAFERLLAEEPLQPEPFLALLHDDTRPSDEALPDTGVGLERERMLSALFIASERYGTRASTVLLLDEGGGGRFVERTFGPGGVEGETCAFAFGPS